MLNASSSHFDPHRTSRSGRRTGWTYFDRRLGRFDRLYGPYDSELPLQETYRSYFLDPAFRRACCGKVTVGGKRDRPTGLCSLAEPRRPSCCSSSTVYPKRKRRRTRLTLSLRQFSPEWPRSNTCAGIRSNYSCSIGGTQPSDHRAKRMTAIYQEIARPAPPVASTPAIDFAIVLARTIADLEKDPAQLRNVVYQLARVKLQQEAAQRDLPVSPLEMEHLTLALESAIDRVETMCSKHDNPRLVQS